MIEPGPTPAGSDESRSDLAAVPVGIEIGMRVVVRYCLDDGQATDALGTLLEADETHLTVDGKRGIEHIERDRIIAAKEVPPPPAPRSPARAR